MAHFAELDENNKVLRVIVISNDVTHNENGEEKEELGIAFCKSLYGNNTKWIQTSYNLNIRSIYARVGDLYDAKKDEFVAVPEENLININSEIIDAEEVQTAIE